MTNNDGIGNGSIPLRIGNLINTTVYGGPYLDVPVDFFGVKMAVEIVHPHMVSVPTRDFDVPEVSDLKAGIVRTLMGIMNEEVIYVGCMGGIGRTGIFLAALAKVQIEYRKSKHRSGRGEDPVLYVRKHFLPHAVETQQQMQYIEDFDVTDIVEWLNVTQIAMGLGGVTPPKAAEATDNFKAGWKEGYAKSGISGFDELESTTPIMPVYDDHETIPSDFDPLSHNYDSAMEGVDPEIAFLREIDSVNNRVDELQEQVDLLQHRSDLFPDNLRISGGRNGMDAFVPAQNNLEKSLTKQTWYEKVLTALK